MKAFLLFIGPGVHLAANWRMHQPAIVIEGKSTVGGLKRSYELVSGSSGVSMCFVLE
eukprot:CAMPEP_0194043952 /NCGR_PEP_ID=MMETSP0009_2-20130614/15510_1 /TAXON_ID=210454 /ORGANISM="Grammatophora oceanica, Strain CCMP 410" /LENGTH=56 /DNA_ID=CAMNT_0038688351 /DNA_START=512 /DNA_END=679 /DNA_ORIENTATION=+